MPTVARAFVLGLSLFGGCERSAEYVAKRYLEEVGAGNMRAARDWVLDECVDSPVGMGAALMHNDVPFETEEVEVSVVSVDETSAVVQFEAHGHYAEVSMGSQHSLEQQAAAPERPRGGVRTGMLHLAKTEDGWRLDCIE